MMLSSIKGLIIGNGKINITVEHWIFTGYMITVLMIVSVTEISAIVRLACLLIPSYESTVYMFDHNVMRRLPKLFRKFQATANTF